jgi:peptide/nickel transport system ATP-binding protein
VSELLLEAKHVSRDFTIGGGMFHAKQRLKAIDDLSFKVNRNEVVGLVGESGCGKSTLARILLGLLAPSAGSVTLSGAELQALDRRDISRRIQPVFQDPYSSLNPRKNIAAIIALPLRVHGLSGEREKVREMMDLVGLPARLADSYPGQLSGGQRQRVAIARALIMRPEIVICDEPTSALDVSVQSQILNLLQRLRRELGLTYVFISHNLAVVEHIATRVAVMYLGRIVEEADTATLFASPRHPYTRALLASVLTPDPALDIPDTGLGIAFPNPLDPPSGCRFHPRCAEVLPHCSTTPPRSHVMERTRVECHLYQETTP